MTDFVAANIAATAHYFHDDEKEVQLPVVGFYLSEEAEPAGPVAAWARMCN